LILYKITGWDLPLQAVPFEAMAVCSPAGVNADSTSEKTKQGEFTPPFCR
jgi:hypothetical protein